MQIELLLGRDYSTYGEVHLRELDSRTVGAICVGIDPDSPSLAHKGDALVPNEDGLLMMQDGALRLLAVADGHHGSGASAAVLEALASACLKVPRVPQQLDSVLAVLEDVPWPDGSGTTLTLACLNPEADLCFGLQWGDSALLSLTEKGATYRCEPSEDYLRRGGENIANARPFRFSLAGVAGVALMTDGIFECHYRSPLTSVRPGALHAGWRRCGQKPREAALEIVQLALGGVQGFPGGQDNIALVMASV